MLSVLVVEDAANIRTQLVRLFEERWSCYEVGAAGSIVEARSALATGDYNLLLLDLGLPTKRRKGDADWKHGRELLRQVRQQQPHLKVIILSTHGELVRDFLKEEGADDFFLKDRREDWLGDKLPSQVERLIGHLGCRSEAGKRLKQDLARLGEATPAVVVEGEPGAGKKHAARVLHLNSRRADRELLLLSPRYLRPETFPVDLAGEEGPLPAPGLLDGDTTGTIVIDHVEDLGQTDPVIQSVLADLLAAADETGLRYTPLGSTRARTSPCRLVFCVAGALTELLDCGDLAPELAQELRRLPVITVPPSRERLTDLPEIVEALRRQCNADRRDDPTTGTDAEAVERLTAALQGGRLRSLAEAAAVVRAACRTAAQTVTAADIDDALPSGVCADKPPVAARPPLVSREVARSVYRQVEEGFAAATDSNEQLQHLDRLAALGEMVSGVVHELATPLTSIVAAAGAINAGRKELDAEQTAEMTRILCDESRRMREMIEDLRRFSRREQEEIRRETDLEELVAAAVKLVRLDPRARHLRISVQTTTALKPVPVYPDRLKQVLLNLLRNAVDAVDAETGALEITLAQTGDAATITVADNGCGIPPEVQDRIFEPFFTTKGEQGTGIGLDISRKIVAAHGGALTMESRPGGGAAFTLTLPLTP